MKIRHKLSLNYHQISLNMHLISSAGQLNGLPLQMSLFPFKSLKFEPRSEKTGLRGFQPGPTQTGLYSHLRWLEA